MLFSLIITLLVALSSDEVEQMNSKKCTNCQTTYEGENYFELRKFFSPSKLSKDGLETRCKNCKREMAKKYRKSQKGISEKYKATNDKRNIASSYMSNNVEHMATEEIEQAILMIQDRLKELKRELKKR